MSRATSLIGRWLAVLAICVVARLSPDIWYEFNRMMDARVDEEIASSIGLLSLVPIVFVESFRFVGSLIAGNVLSMLRYIVPALMAGASIFAYPIVESLGGDLDVSIQRARFVLFRERYGQCAATAHTSFSTNKYNTCEYRMAGNYSRAIVYDTSGEVALQPAAQSSEFKKFASRPDSHVFSGCERQFSTQLAPHFFYLQSAC
jgi:hypothetical protein